MGVGVGDEGIEAMFLRLRLGFDLQRVVVCFADIAEERDGVEGAVGRNVRRPSGQTAERVAEDDPTQADGLAVLRLFPATRMCVPREPA